MNRRIIELFYDVEARKLYDGNGFTLSSNQMPHITYSEQVLVQLQLVKNKNLDEYVDLPADVTFSCVLDDDYDHNSPAFIKTLNDEFNLAGDWKLGGTADYTLGQLSFPLDAFTSIFEENIGTNRQIINTKLEIKLLDSTTTSLVWLREMPFYCKNLMDNDGVVPPNGDLSNYFSKTQSDARYATKDVEDDILTLSGEVALAAEDFNITDIKVADYDAVVKDSIRTNTTAGSFNINLPTVGLEDGDEIAFVDVYESWQDENLILVGGGKNIDGSSDDFICNVNKAYFEIQYIATTDNWMVKEVPSYESGLTGDIHSHTNIAFLNDIDQDVSISGDVEFNTISTPLMGDVKDYIDGSVSSGSGAIRRENKYLSLSQNYIQLDELINASKPITAVLPNSPTLTNGYGINVSGDRLYLDSELPYEENYNAAIEYEVFTEDGFDDYISFTSINDEELLENVYVSCLIGETNDIRIAWCDGDIDDLTIDETETEITHNYESFYNFNVKSVLIGSEDGSNIETFILHDNKVIFVNVSSIPTLKNLHCYNNILTGVSLADNVALERIQFSQNLITEISLTNNINLVEVDLNSNKLVEVNTSTNTLIENLNLSSNMIPVVNLNTNSNIKTLDLSINLLENIDISNNSLIETINVSQNNLIAGESDGSESGTLNHILKKLDESGIEDGYCNLENQIPDNEVDTVLISNLTAKGWTVLT